MFFFGTIQVRLHGFYRVRPGHPGFAIPIFSSGAELVVQQIDAQGSPIYFRPCDVAPELLIAIDQAAEMRAGVDPWKAAVFAFQRLDQRIEYGTKEQLIPVLRRILPKVEDRAFLSLEIARFIEDDTLAEQALERTNLLLYGRVRSPERGPRRSAVIGAERQEGESPFIPETDRPSGSAIENHLEALKARLIQSRLATEPDLTLVRVIHLAANEAAALAWSTPFPLLVFPELFSEKANSAVRYHQRRRTLESSQRDRRTVEESTGESA